MRSRLSVQDHLQQVTVWREFNRFYTARLGLLRSRYLNSEFSLTESRILYELLREPGRTATALRKTLGLDAGYISRLLLSLAKRGLVQQASSAADAREKLLKLSAKGLELAEQVDRDAGEDIGNILKSLEGSRRKILVASLARVHQILNHPPSKLEIVQASLKNLADVRSLLTEYFEAVDVVQRDTSAHVRKLLSDPSAGLWIAYMGTMPAGCVVLRPLPSQRLAGECKRLYVRPAFRGSGIAKALLDRLEAFAVSRGLDWIYLDSKDDLHAAIQVYRKRGYRSCKRYNDNPQATIFLRKKVGKSPARATPEA